MPTKAAKLLLLLSSALLAAHAAIATPLDDFKAAMNTDCAVQPPRFSVTWNKTYEKAQDIYQDKGPEFYTRLLKKRSDEHSRFVAHAMDFDGITFNSSGNRTDKNGNFQARYTPLKWLLAATDDKSPWHRHYARWGNTLGFAPSESARAALAKLLSAAQGAMEREPTPAMRNFLRDCQEASQNLSLLLSGRASVDQLRALRAFLSQYAP